MGSQDFQLDSGAKLHVTPSSYQDVNTLLKAIYRALKGSALSAEAAATDIEKVRENPALLSGFLDKILSVAASDEVEAALFKCAERATYETMRVTPDLFDDVKLGERARQDHYAILYRIAEVNVRPFFKGAFSALLTARQTPPAGRKSS